MKENTAFVDLEVEQFDLSNVTSAMFINCNLKIPHEELTD